MTDLSEDQRELMHRGLPKWPQHYVTGERVTVAQANEIIRRTDTFFAGSGYSNDKVFTARIRRMMGMGLGYDDIPHGGALEVRQQLWKRLGEEQAAFETRWAPLTTQYVHNSWVANAFIGGPHGWCQPTGFIGFIDNIGKWPSIEDVRNDWLKIAEAFPFLKIGATLFSGEECENDHTEKVVSFVIAEGDVTLVDPAQCDVHAKHAPAVRREGAHTSGDVVQDFANLLQVQDELGRDAWHLRERGLPETWFVDWAVRFGPKAVTP